MIKIDCSTLQGLAGKEFEATVVGISEGQKNLKSLHDLLSSSLLDRIEKFLSRPGFSAKKNDLLTFDMEGKGAEKLYVIVLPKEPSLDGVRQACGRMIDFVNAAGHQAVRIFADSFQMKDVPLADLVEAVAEGIHLSLYRFDKFKSSNSKKSGLKLCQFVFRRAPDLQRARGAVQIGQTIAESVNFTRDLVNAPANELPPRVLAERASKMAEECGVSFQAFGKKELRRMGMGGILAVSQGSVEEPRLIVLEYGNLKAPVDFVFVGKGITFDSGGISIKGSEAMEKMKYDMAGGAAVMGILRTVAKLKLGFHVVGIVPAAENLPSGTASRPGDVIRMGSGKMVEILNTDAEGRLVLGDGLFYAQRYKPKVVVDLATLTGSCVVALGHFAIGLLGNDEKVMGRVREAGERTGERVWPFPLWDEYFDQIKSDVADIKNIGGKGAGTITAAMFLKQFVSYPWAHLDIAGTAWTEERKPYCPKGGTGVGVRLLAKMLRDWKK